MSAVVEEKAAAPETSAPEVVAVADLLKPIEGENPAGESLQYAGLHDEIREARRADEDIAMGEWQRELKVADWDEVIELATGALSTKTKDLQVAAWLTEALIKEHGFAGLRDGLKVMRGLHEQFWEKVYPEIDEGDLEARANSLAWMDAQASRALKEVPLTRSPTGTGYSFFQWEESKQFDIPENYESLDSEARDRADAARARAAEDGKVNGEQWRTAKNTTPRKFYEDTTAVLDECWSEFQALDRVMDEKFERQTPGLGTLKKTLDEIRDVVSKIVKEKRALEPQPGEDGAEGDGAGGNGEFALAGGGGGVAGTTGPIRSRQDALRRLGEVAAYFRQTEPHSPVSYLAQRAINWGQMPLDVWLQDVIKDGTMLDHLRETLGLNTSNGGGASE